MCEKENESMSEYLSPDQRKKKYYSPNDLEIQ
jgi:hypothetical protein